MISKTEPSNAYNRYYHYNVQYYNSLFNLPYHNIKYRSSIFYMNNYAFTHTHTHTYIAKILAHTKTQAYGVWNVTFRIF